MKDVTLQISLAPNDLPHSKYLLFHQLDVWHDQVAEVLLTYETRKSKGRFGEAWESNDAAMRALMQTITELYPKIDISYINYSQHTREQISALFFRSHEIPEKDFRGGPFYSYFYGLYAASNPFVLHIDADMFFGGRSQTWVKEAIELLQSFPNIFACSPLPGPPRHDGILHQDYSSYHSDPSLYAFNTFSTRVFLLDRRKLIARKLRLSSPGLRSCWKATINGHPPYDLPETILSKYLRTHHLYRIDFLGQGAGMWSLHPPLRDQSFYEALPTLVEGIEAGKVPTGQTGHYDLMADYSQWTEVLSA